MGLLRGLGMILSSGMQHQLREFNSFWSKSSFRDGLITCGKYLSDSVQNIKLNELANYALDRTMLINKQNYIILRTLFSTPSTSQNIEEYSENMDSNISSHNPVSTTPVNKAVPRPLSEQDRTLIYSQNKKTVQSKERRVPSSRLGRIAGFGNLAVGLGLGAASEWTQQKLGFTGDGASATRNIFLTEANLERIVDTLCRMRGAALKLGQLLSIQDESLVSPQIQKIFERVRQAADFMPAKQMFKVLNEELGPDWPDRIKNFEEKPFAAASIGQVHKAFLPDGRPIALKIQYPGIADSIDADVNNLMALLKRFDILPRGLFADRAIEVAKYELRNECDYLREAEYAKRFAEMLKDDSVFRVPRIFDELTTSRVLTAEYMEGLALDDCISLPQDVRNWMGEQLLRLCLKELFVYRIMQTDPNWSNFLYNPQSGEIILLDFGASREYDKSFVDIYIRLIHAASENERENILAYSKALGFLTGYETKIMIQAHIDAVSILGEAFASTKPFDFGSQSTTKKINNLIPIMLEHRLTPPPDETYSLHRKMSGCFLLCGKLKAEVNCRPLFQEIYRNYEFSQSETSPTGL